MKFKQIKKSAVLFLIGFVLLFSLRAVYEFWRAGRNIEVTYGQSVNTVEAIENKNIKNNYASSKTVVVAGETAKSVSVDQKYERVGFVTSESNKFEEDSSLVKSIIREDKAIVQFENNTGTKGNRMLELSMGVHPDKFDEFVEKLKKVGNLTDFRVQKTDKTSEYKDLNAKLVTLQKYRESLVSLKAQGGSISDLISLENKILEVDEKIQAFGVQLGDFNQENELCTVKMTLRENMGIAKKNEMSLFMIAKTLTLAFAWSVGYYAIFLIMLLLGGICGYVLLIVFEKSKKLLEEHKTKEIEN